MTLYKRNQYFQSYNSFDSENYLLFIIYYYLLLFIIYYLLLFFI